MKTLTRIAKIRVDLWEVLLVGALLAMLPFVFRGGRPTSERELEPYSVRYGPDHQSEDAEEWFIRDFFADRRGGFFVDVGANDPRKFSKTWYLEKRLGWSGIAVEPLAQFAAAYRTERPQTRFRSFFVSDTSDAAARLYVISGNTAVSSSDPKFTGSFGKADRVETVPTITMNDLLGKEGVTAIDFLNVDIELHEPVALKGFDVTRYKPALVCIEALLPVRQQILDYFARHGYVVVGKYLRADQENLYFTPLGG